MSFVDIYKNLSLTSLLKFTLQDRLLGIGTLNELAILNRTKELSSLLGEVRL